jgi:ADP-ribose pyrophosphatase YjhB (NUDIX family)
MKEKQIRPIAVAAIKHPDGRYFVFIGYDKNIDKKFYRMQGGGIEFGEPAKDALMREFREEFDAEIKVGNLIYVKEWLYEFEGEPGHQIVFLYEAEFADKSLYSKERIPNNDAADGVWLHIPELVHFGWIE